MNVPYTRPSPEQAALLEEILQSNEALFQVLRQLSGLGLPDCYIGAGCIIQTVWNHLYGYPPSHGILDLDIVYFDPSDLSRDSEAAAEQAAAGRFWDIPYKIDVTNEARVHLWYADKFGREIAPYQSTEHAISTWPTIVSSLGVAYRENRFTIYTPFGLEDLFSGVVRPNRVQVTREIYESKAARWKEKWPALTVMDWYGAAVSIP